MQLKKSVKTKLKNKDNGRYTYEFEEFFKFLDNNYIKKLTPNAKPEMMIGQNCIVLLQTNLYRTKSLFIGYLEGFNKNNPLMSTLCLRALYETTGSLAFLHKRYFQYSSGSITIEQFEETLRRLYLGIKDKGGLPEAPDPINVMTSIDAVDYYLKSKYSLLDRNFRATYDDLSERCHPNSFGYLLGHDIETTSYAVSFSDNNTIHRIEEYDLEKFSIASTLYKEIYDDLRRYIEEYEEIPFKELYNFKNYKWKNGPNKSPYI
ncbi:hypothetical protein MPH47_19550 [Psychrobacillus psychrodurans]|uniref:hypothetical protein n=1 Tax=Psychrobacillus psychrodurans TaxID=126157 RepID=UPI001F4D7778|nr:hypothetical protein [Psychrobacillus psychrodurans]MCK1999393.1 hypothetical protein [Psychrobacillus psychrodurans]